MHVARERQGDEENPEGKRVTPPGRLEQSPQHLRVRVAGKQAADRAGEKAPAPVERARQALGRQPQREDEPEGREGNAVAHHAVSYTHLDVYKRQALDGKPSFA